jgi:hypothetical protein
MKHDWLKWGALVAALVATASAEYELARAVGFNKWVAAAVPAALDLYTVRALRARREVLAAVAAMIGVNAASHLVTTGLLPVNVWLVVAVAAIAPLVLWRVHSLGSGHDEGANRRDIPTVAVPETAVAEPVAVTVQRPPVPPLVQVPARAVDPFAGKPYKELLPALPEPVAEPESGPEPEPSAVDFLARQHRIRPEQLRTVAELLADTPDLSGKAAGEAIERGDRYGRRVLLAAKELRGVRS